MKFSHQPFSWLQFRTRLASEPVRVKQKKYYKLNIKYNEENNVGNDAKQQS